MAFRDLSHLRRRGVDHDHDPKRPECWDCARCGHCAVVHNEWWDIPDSDAFPGGMSGLACLAPDGRLGIIGLQRGRHAQIDLGTLLAKRVSVHGTTLRARPAVQKAAIMADVAAHAWPLLTPTPDVGARLRPVVHARLPLAQAARAHELLESGDVFGKVLLLP